MQVIPAVVSCCEPIPSGVPEDSFVAVPRHPVGLSIDELVTSLEEIQHDETVNKAHHRGVGMTAPPSTSNEDTPSKLRI